MKIFVTGGTGFIGKHVIEKLLHLSCYEIIVLTRQSMRNHSGVSYLKGDLSDTKLLEAIIAEVDPTTTHNAVSPMPLVFVSDERHKPDSSSSVSMRQAQ